MKPKPHCARADPAPAFERAYKYNHPHIACPVQMTDLSGERWCAALAAACHCGGAPPVCSSDARLPEEAQVHASQNRKDE